MKKLLLTTFVVILSFSLTAQESNKSKELGLSFASLNSFGLTYKFGNDKALWRINSLLIMDNYQKADQLTFQPNDSFERTTKQSSQGYAIQFGREFRKPIAEDFQFRYGLDLSFAYYSSNNSLIDENFNTETSTYSFHPGLAFVLGVNYFFNENFLIGLEILPSIVYSTGKQSEFDSNTNETTEFDVTSWTYGLTSSNVLITLAYSF